MMSTRFSCRRRGVAAVEFAVVAPVFFSLVFGVIEFGRMMNVAEVLTNAARVGARVAAFPGSTDQECKNAITNYLTQSKVNGYDTPTVSPSTTSATSGTAITVTVSVPFNKVSYLTKWLGSKTLTSKVTVTKE